MIWHGLCNIERVMTDGPAKTKQACSGGHRRERHPYRTTLLGLVQRLVGQAESDREVIATARRLVRSGRVVLTGSFRGERLEPIRR